MTVTTRTAIRASCAIALLGAMARLLSQCSFAMPPQLASDTAAHAASSLRGGAGEPQGHAGAGTCGFAVAAATAVAAVAVGSARRGSRLSSASVTPLRYTTQEILPSLCWLNSGIDEKELNGGNLIAVCLAGVDIVLGKTEGGKLFACADKCPPTGTSISVGGEVVGQCVVDPQYGTKFDVFTGYPEDEWCPSPPVIGGFVGFLMGGPQCIQTFDVRMPFLGSTVEVQVDINTRKQYEAAYWKGLLDAQGKNDGTYY